MPRIFLPIDRSADSIRITGEKARYLSTVLRCKEGDEVQIFDGKGLSYRAMIRAVTRKEVLVDVTGVLQSDTESPIEIILVQGLLKGEKLDLVIQKTTELGVKEIIPAVTERSQVRETRKVARWRKIAEDAARQSGRSSVPAVREPVELSRFLEGLPHPGKRGESGKNRGKAERGLNEVKESRGFLFWEDEGLPMREAISRVRAGFKPALTRDPSSFAGPPIYLLVGPEGGFTSDEAESAKARGFIIASLGNRILRAETAAISATAIVQFFLGDLG